MVHQQLSRFRGRFRGLLLASCVALAAVASGCSNSPGQSHVHLLTDDVVWVAADGQGTGVHLRLSTDAAVDDVQVRVNASKLARVARLSASDRRCRIHGAIVECRLGDLSSGRLMLLVPVRIQPKPSAAPKDGIEVPVRASSSGGAYQRRQTVIQIVRSAHFIARPEKPAHAVAASGTVALRPAILNVGPKAASDVHLELYSTEGSTLLSRFRNCRPSPVTAGALCTFSEKVQPGAAVTVDQPLKFGMTGMIHGNLSYLATDGPNVDDAAIDDFGVAPAGAPELRLVPINPTIFRSATGGLTSFGGFIDVKTRAKAKIVARGTRLPAVRGRTMMLVGVENKSARVVDASGLLQDPFLGRFTVDIPEGVRVVYIPYPGEEGWGDCSPHQPGKSRYECRIPERLVQGQPWLQPFSVKIDPKHSGKAGRVTIHLQREVKTWDSTTADNSAAIRVGQSGK